MRLLSFLRGEKAKSANLAKDRLQFILAHERDGHSRRIINLPELQRDLMGVVSKHMQIDLSDVKVEFEREGNLEVLRVKIELPDQRN